MRLNELVQIFVTTCEDSLIVNKKNSIIRRKMNDSKRES